MRIELILNPEAEGFGQLQTDLQLEINALANQASGVRITTERVPSPAGTLVVDEVVRFVVEHQDEIKAGSVALFFLKALIETARAVVGRQKGVIPPKKQKEKRAEPTIIVLVNDSTLQLPSSAAKEKAFLKALENPRVPRTAPKAKSPKRAKGKKK